MNAQWQDLLDHLPAYLGGHMLLSAAALGVGLLVSIPLGVAVSRRPRAAELTLGIAGVIQTVPSLALLALMVLLLGGAIGFRPAFVALTLYSILPILANTVVGLRGVDATLIEAARGLGMSERQMLFRVQLPLAAPVILSGIRTSTVLVVGTATLATPVGGTCLGNYIFSGLGSMNPSSTVFGCVVAAALAVVMDQCVRLLEVGARRRDRRLARLGAVGLTGVFLLGLVGPVANALDPRPRGIVASGPFTEQSILNEVISQRLREAGFRADQRIWMSEGIQIEALRHSQIDCMVNYTGNIWTLVMKRDDPIPAAEMLKEVERFLGRDGIVCLGSLGFDDAYAFAMRGDDAAKKGIKTLEDLARLAADRARAKEKLRIGGDDQFFDRPEWRRVQTLYGLREDDVVTRPMDPALMYDALRDGQLDAIVCYTSDGRVGALKLQVLRDPHEALPPYDAILLVSPKAAQRETFVKTLQQLEGSISQEAMQSANYRVDAENWTPRQAAGELLVRSP